MEHPVEPFQAARAFLLVQVDDRLGVGPRLVAVPLGLELGPELHVVVDLAAEREPDGAVLVRHRLVAGRGEIDDREPAVRKGDAMVRRVPGAAVVRAAVDDRLAHGRDELFADVEAVARGEDPADAAHQALLAGGGWTATGSPEAIESRAASATLCARYAAPRPGS